MALVSIDDLQTGAGLDKFGPLGKVMAGCLYYAMRMHKINSLYDRNKHLPTDDFLESLLKDIDIEYEIHQEDLKRIPATGPFIIIANHPLGAIDGIMMMSIIRKVRPDFKEVGNFLLQKIEPLKEIIFPVNPFEMHKAAKSSLSGLKDALYWLNEGHGVGIFPAGEVSQKVKETGEITDKEWSKSAIKFIKKAGVPIVPMYFNAKNSDLFYQLGNLHPTLQTALLPQELVKKHQELVKIRIGKAISLKQQNDYKDLKDYSKFLRKKVELLGSFYETNEDKTKIFSLFQTPIIQNKIPIALETNKELILAEIENLRNYEKCLVQSNQFEVFWSKSKNIPHILREIGRLREITFREIGEGSNQPLDLDEFDEIYHHIFLWDNTTQKIVGAYRLGIGSEIFSKNGLKSFYTSKQFKFDKKLEPFFKKVIEMGRAFVISEYQQKPMSLFLLWKGIVHITFMFPKNKYLMGGVSISNKFSNFSKSLMVDFMESHYYDNKVAKYIKPKKEYKLKFKNSILALEEAKSDINKFDKLIDELEPNNLRLPVLLKKYIRQNAKVIGFSVDPNFNNAIDGLMYIRIKDLPEDTVKPVLEERMEKLEQAMNFVGFSL